MLAEIALEALVCEYLGRYPEVAVDLHVAAERIDLRVHAIDVAFRTAPLADDPSMRQRKLARSTVAMVAHPAYLAARGTPRSIDELAGHDCIVVGPGSTWALRERRVPVGDRLRVNGFGPAKRAALAGLGIAQFSTAYARAELAAGELRVVMPEQSTESTLYAVMPGSGPLGAKVRAFLELATQRITTERLL